MPIGFLAEAIYPVCGRRGNVACFPFGFGREEMLKIIGAGLGRTGTRSLHDALTILGYRCLHFDETRLNDVLIGADRMPNFRRYDDVDAVIDLPASWFYRELLEAYPDSKVILTVRDLDDWWRSILAHFSYYQVAEESRMKHRIGRLLNIPGLMEDEYHQFRRRLRNLVYGSPTPKEFLYKKRFVDHNRLVIATVPAERLLVIDICGGDGWEKLCPFLSAPFPNTPFPHVHGPRDAAARVGTEA
jgi:hypothetical protein